MSKIKVDFNKLAETDTETLQEFEVQLYRNMARDDIQRREEKTGGKKKRRSRR